MDTYNPERDITNEFVTTVNQWIETEKEVFVVLRYLGAAGSKDYAFLSSTIEFHKLLELCPLGTDIIVFKENQLPIRGEVTQEFIQAAKEYVPDGTEYMYVRLVPMSEGDPRLWGEMGDRHTDLVSDLEDEIGEMVAFGRCPPFIQEDNDVMISASKGGIDGPR